MEALKLVDNQTGNLIKVGDEVVTFRGERARLVAVFPNDGKSGRVRIEFLDRLKDEDPIQGYYFPSVIGAHFE